MDIIASNIENQGVSYPQDFYINKLEFKTSSGSIDFKKLMVEISYYEDIFAFVVSGHITVIDAQGFIEGLQLDGNEFLTLEYSKTKNSVSNNNTFRVYKIGDRTPGSNLNTNIYTLYFCSEELLLSEQSKITKTYAGTKISDIINDILVGNALGVSSNRVYNIEETIGVYDFAIPRFKPFESISWLSTYARPKANNKLSDMLFFETKDGFNFRSIKSMFSKDALLTYKYQLNNVEVEDIAEKIFTVLDYEFVKTQDMLENISSGMLANKLISIDPLKRSYSVTNFNVDTDTNIGSLKNRLGKTQIESYDSVIKVATSNSNQKNSPYIKQREGSVAQDVFIESYLPSRTSQINLSNYIKIKIVVPGNPILVVGNTINFNLLSQRNNKDNNKKDLDFYYSGKYLITAVRHVIGAQGRYVTTLEIVKEKTENKYPDNSGTSSYWNKLVKL
jgi:hypothetical protein